MRSSDGAIPPKGPRRLAVAVDGIWSRLTNDRPQFASIRNQALAHIDRGEFDAGRATLARGRETARALRDNVSRNEAEFLADEARIDHLLLDYRAAAQKFAEAAALVTLFNRMLGENIWSSRGMNSIIREPNLERISHSCRPSASTVPH
jgi:hypothetical protein